MGTYNVLFYGGLVLAIIFLIVTIALFFVLKIPKVFGDLTGRTERKAIEEIRTAGYESKSKKDAIQEKSGRITVRDAENDPETGNLEKRHLERKAAEEAKISSRASEIRASLDEETEVLGSDKPYEKIDEFDDQTEILGADENEETTDILRQNSDFEDDGDTTDILVSEDDGDTTDILTSEDDDTTDILTSEDAGDVTDAKPDEADRTFEQKESNIIGRYSAEETAVLRSIHEPVSAGKTENNKGITVIYNVTVVHTDEILRSEVNE